jgi:5-carboxymethyl-2-hydroxymuconate isomerase
MPHFQIEYSANVEDWLDLSAFCDHIRQAAVAIDTFPMAGVRVRALRADHYAIADGGADHGFIDMSIRLRAGRPEPVKQDAANRIFQAAKDFLAPVFASHSLALSLEMRDIDPDLSPKTGTIRDHLES